MHALKVFYLNRYLEVENLVSSYFDKDNKRTYQKLGIYHRKV